MSRPVNETPETPQYPWPNTVPRDWQLQHHVHHVSHCRSTAALLQGRCELTKQLPPDQLKYSVTTLGSSPGVLKGWCGLFLEGALT